MAPKMRGQVSTKEKLVEPHTKNRFNKQNASELKIRLNNIRQARMEEIEWEKHWANFTKWGLINDEWKQETINLEKAQIRLYMSMS